MLVVLIKKSILWNIIIFTVYILFVKPILFYILFVKPVTLVSYKNI